ncbi:MAG TPA: hypothetical protein ENG87_01080 [Candidatus Pacearchaeota archaeon]|nr:hypothetical protein BMS3Abin17_00389 [archaeon BMS3Abin17]HDK41943.1 hypothetical protein [Candidatus Pacearchaeota archaeon]HDZ60253.1 hypothetical protein [Candidatus Pacearchaeota archaeon]
MNDIKKTLFEGIGCIDPLCSGQLIYGGKQYKCNKKDCDVTIKDVNEIPKMIREMHRKISGFHNNMLRNYLSRVLS